MVRGKFVGQLQFVLPAGVETLQNAELLKKLDGSVYAGAVNLARSLNQLVHAQRLLAQERFKYG